ncbi:Folliculin [Schistosoma japonicum]|nr:Folliculin [Schistosoma japonicum]KAH8869470.1 Folliculin [Schistosoma japonicum]KAH8869471.1 Folliculin [Schistosoma japonicum]
MDALVVLCHFCEQHGPSVIMCTQSFKQPQSKSSVSSAPDPNTTTATTTNNTNTKDVNTYQRKLSNTLQNNDDAIFTGDVSPIPIPSSSSKFSVMSNINITTQQQQHQQQSHPTCKACSSILLHDELGIISYDHSANLSYISTQFVKDADLGTHVRNACLRSLSSEVCPGQVGAFYFGDELNGHVLSYNFPLNDSRARGNQSRYSILVLSWDKIHLLSLWSFLISNISRMVSRLRLSANRVFNDETSDNAAATNPLTHSNPPKIIAPLRRCATPPASLAPNLYKQAIAAGNAVTAGYGLYNNATLGRETKQKRATDSDMRSLADLTKDDQIFYRLHAWFTWLLRAGSRQWSIVPPSIGPPVDEDSIVAQEEYEAFISAGFECFTSSSSRTAATISASGVGTGDTFSLPGNKHGSVSCINQSIGSTLLSKSLNQSTNSTRDSIEITGSKKLTLYLNSMSVEMSNFTSFMILSRLFNVFDINTFSRLVQHIAVGNQLVVQSLTEDIHSTLTLTALAKLLPKGCVRQVVGSHEYLAPFRCNLLSVTNNISMLEDDINIAKDVLYLAVYRCECKSSSTSATITATSTEFNAQSFIQSYVNSLYFKLCSKLPTFDSELISFKQSPCCCLSTVNHPSIISRQLLTGRVAVSNYVQQINKLFSINPPLPIDVYAAALSSIHHEWINRARLLYSFKRCQGSSLSGDEATRRWSNVLASINCQSAENAAVARFWQGALSQYSRNNICHLRKCPTNNNSTNTSRRGSFSSSNADLNAAVLAATNIQSISLND